MPGVRPLEAARFHASSCTGRIETAETSARSWYPVATACAPLGASPSGVMTSTEAPASTRSAARPRSRRRVSGSVARTIAVMFGPASSSGACRSAAEHDGDLLVAEPVLELRRVSLRIVEEPLHGEGGALGRGPRPVD